MGQLYVDTDGVSQSYASLAAALASLPATFTEDNYIYCAASTGVADTTAIPTAAYNTTANYRLYVVGSSGYKLSFSNADRWTLTNSDITNYMNITVTGVNFEKSAQSASYQQILFISALRNGSMRFVGCSFLGANVGTTWRDRIIELDCNPTYDFRVIFANNTFVGRSTSASIANCIVWNLQQTKACFYFNTVKGYKASGTANANAVWKDNIIKTTVTSDSVATTSDYNMHSGAFTMGGTNDEQGRTFVFVDEAGFDFHLDSSDTGAQDAGVSLASDAHYALTDDYDGVTRGDPPDCGAHEIAVDNAVVLSPVSVIATPGALAVEQENNSVALSPCSVVASLAALTVAQASETIIIDHEAVAKYEIIPESYKTSVKQNWLSVPGESHAGGYRAGLALLEAADASFAVNVTESGTPEMPTSEHLRASGASWGDYNHATLWRYYYGEEDWYTNAAALAQTKVFLQYAHDNGFGLSAVGFGWCWDMSWHHTTPTVAKDPVYKCGWCGASEAGPEGDLAWGLDAADTAITGNSVCMDTYLNATREYIAYCEAHGIPTRVFFTTGPVDSYSGENAYQRHVKHEYIRNDIETNGGVLFDYADIEAWDDAGTEKTLSWTDGDGSAHSYQYIADDNLLNLDGSDGSGTTGYHIGERGALRLGKALWVMLAMLDGWDGEPETNAVQLSPASTIASPAALTVAQVPPQSVTLSPVSVVATPSPLAIGQLIPQPVSLSPASILATPGALAIGQSGPQIVSLSPVSVIATPAALAIYQGIPPGLIDITISEGPRLLVKVIEGGVTMDSASPIMLEAVEERGTKSIALSVSYESAGVEVAFVPKTASWSLYDINEVIVNGKEDEPISSLAASITIVLSGLDLDASVNDELRRLVVKGTYDSALGTDLPFVKEVQFHIIKIAGQ